jgi:transposase-like protein
MPNTYKMDLMKLVERFHDETACREYLEGLRWPDGVRCPRCESGSISRLQDRGLFDCNSCHYQFSVRVGTLFHDSHLPLWKWFVATYLMMEGKKGISANQMKRTLGVSYKTAWYLCHRIRAAMGSGEQAPLSGTVEVDETFVGGKTRGMGRGYRGNKTIVAGAVQRGGEIRLDVVGDTTRRTLHRFIREHTDPETDAIYTDDWPAYQGIGDHDTRHEAVNHSAKEYVRGDVHTNTVESAWSLFKRGVVGSYHKLSAKHLEAYLAEFEWRYNNRDNPWLFRDTLLRLIGSANLPFSELVS